MSMLLLCENRKHGDLNIITRVWENLIPSTRRRERIRFDTHFSPGKGFPRLLNGLSWPLDYFLQMALDRNQIYRILKSLLFLAQSLGKAIARR